jgi:hypothetical protein
VVVERAPEARRKPPHTIIKAADGMAYEPSCPRPRWVHHSVLEPHGRAADASTRRSASRRIHALRMTNQYKRPPPELLPSIDAARC